MVAITINDVAHSSNTKPFIPINVSGAIQAFLNKSHEDDLILEARNINPFLRCLEAMRETAEIQLDYTFNNEPFYRVRHVKCFSGCIGSE